MLFSQKPTQSGPSLFNSEQNQMLSSFTSHSNPFQPQYQQLQPQPQPQLQPQHRQQLQLQSQPQPQPQRQVNVGLKPAPKFPIVSQSQGIMKNQPQGLMTSNTQLSPFEQKRDNLFSTATNQTPRSSLFTPVTQTQQSKTGLFLNPKSQTPIMEKTSLATQKTLILPERKENEEQWGEQDEDFVSREEFEALKSELNTVYQRLDKFERLLMEQIVSKQGRGQSSMGSPIAIRGDVIDVEHMINNYENQTQPNGKDEMEL